MTLRGQGTRGPGGVPFDVGADVIANVTKVLNGAPNDLVRIAWPPALVKLPPT